MKRVSKTQAGRLLHNKFVIVLGDSIQRSVYKDLVLLVQEDRFLSLSELKSKGEMSFEKDCLMEGGQLGPMSNGTEYREVRQFCSNHHLLRFYFVTRVYSRYMESILADLACEPKPDVVIINSCLWDVSRYSQNWVPDYRENLQKLFLHLKRILPPECLVLWNMTMPVGTKIVGGFLVPEIEHMVPTLRYDVIEANFYGATLADAYGLDVLDLHYHFRFSLQERTKDGVHWNALAHRRISCLLLEHVAQAWGVELHGPSGETSMTMAQLGSTKTAAKETGEDLAQFPWRPKDRGPCQDSSFFYENAYQPRRSAQPAYGARHFSFEVDDWRACESAGFGRRCHRGETGYVMKKRRSTKREYAPYPYHQPSYNYRW